LAIRISALCVWIDVKGLAKKNPWLVKRKETRPDLYYVLVFLSLGERNEFFILPQRVANSLVAQHLERPTRAIQPRWDGFAFNAPADYRSKWKLLPQ
jgi:hypothetical protein